MKPAIDIISNKGDVLKFTLSNVDVSIANSLRRIILSDIPTIVLKNPEISINTSRLNDQLIAQRLGSIPVHISKISEFPFKNYSIEVDVENITDSILFVTTKDFKVFKDKEQLSESAAREIFPPNNYTGHFIDFARLRPRISDELPGQKIYLKSGFGIGTARENGMYNVVSTCSYGNTLDEQKINTELAKKKQIWKDEGKTEDEIKFDIQNWKLLDAHRIFIPNSFDFILQTIGIYTNVEILDSACSIFLGKLRELDTFIDKDELEIKTSLNTMENCFDVILQNEDYTLGKVLEFIIIDKYFQKQVTFCGFSVAHPHDHFGTLRVAFKDSTEKSIIKKYLKESIADLIEVYEKIRVLIHSKLNKATNK